MSYYLGYHMRKWLKDNSFVSRKEALIIREMTIEMQGILDRRCDNSEDKEEMLELFHIMVRDFLNREPEKPEETADDGRVIPIGGEIITGGESPRWSVFGDE